MSKPESRYIVTKSEHNGVPWSDVAVQRSPGMYTVYKLTEVARGTPAELAAMADPDAPVIEVVVYSENPEDYEIVCGDWAWDGKWIEYKLFQTTWTKKTADGIAALLTKFKHFPPVESGGAQ